MKCPVDNETLQMTSREGVEIDYCPTCRGVWLDRGELDKIIERSPATNSNEVSQDYGVAPGQPMQYPGGGHHGGNAYGGKHGRSTKHKSSLGDFFNF